MPTKPVPVPLPLEPSTSRSPPLPDEFKGAHSGESRTRSSEILTSPSLKQVRSSLSSHFVGEEVLLRGVRIDRALMRFGTHWSGTVTGGYDDQAADACYNLSEEAEILDDFISHEWVTGRWPKFVSLCVVYNGRRAVVAGALASWGGAVLQILFPRDWVLRQHSDQYILGRMVSCEVGFQFQFLGAAAFLIVLFFGQRLQLLLGLRHRMAFVDKLCIHQGDNDLKAKGISSLGGFLRHSERLLVLWTPRYLSRLWCVYELATWIHLMEEAVSERPAHFVPVALSYGVLLLSATMFTFYLILSATTQQASRTGLFLPLVACCALVLLPSLHGVRRLTRDLQHLGNQLSSFSVRDAECYCCKHGHVHPVSGEVLSCDRKLVYKVLQRWFSLDGKDSELNHEKCLDCFDEYVRNTFRPKVLLTMCPTRLHYSQALVVSSPCLWWAADRVAVARDFCDQASFWHFLAFLASLLTLSLAVWPSSAQLIWRLSFHVDRICGTPPATILDMAVTVLYFIAALMMAMGLWYFLSYGQNQESVLVLFVVLILQVLLTVTLYLGNPCLRFVKTFLTKPRGSGERCSEGTV